VDGSLYTGDEAIATLASVTIPHGKATSETIQKILEEKPWLFFPGEKNKPIKVGVFNMLDEKGVPTGNLSIDINISHKNRVFAEDIGIRNNQHSIYDPLKERIPEINPLTIKARKYKSAEEFFEANPTYYHGTTNAQAIEKNGFGDSAKDVKYGDAVYLSPSKWDAISFGHERSAMRGNPQKPAIVEVGFTQEPKIFSAKKEPSASEISKLKSEGFDGIQFTARDTYDSEGFISQPGRQEAVIWNKDILKTKSQLTEIWDKRNEVLPKEYGDITLTGGSGEQVFTDAQIREVIDAAPKFNVDNPEVAKLANGYMQRYAAGKQIKNDFILTLDKNNAENIADAFDAMPDTPNAPHVLKAYNALAKEPKDQYDWLVKKGYRIEPWKGEGQPYENSAAMVEDVLNNKHLYFFLTDEGFGSGVSASHPLLKQSGIVTNGIPLRYNDLFRAVHDIFGHTKIGNQFGALGEENAWRLHSQMFSKDARRAMTTETRGQNSWVNFGKHLRGKNVKVKDRPYAEQKTGLLPDSFVFGKLD
jgi:hypothetical protein